VSERMRVLDLFSGACGGWSLGLHRAGFVTVAACEIDEWRRRQFGRNFPDARLYDDVRSITAERLRADGAWPIDVVCGSPPCQDASTANTKGRGIDGERTGLYLEAVRVVREVRPRWCAFENVPGIRNRGIDRVLGELEAAGYAPWPLVVGALDLGAPHIRKRSWIVCADASTLQRLAQPWDQPNGNSIGIAAEPDSKREFGGAVDGEVVGGMDDSFADADARRIRQQLRWGGRENGASAAVVASGIAADSGGDSRDARQHQAGRQSWTRPEGEPTADTSESDATRRREDRGRERRPEVVECFAGLASGPRLEIERGERRHDGAQLAPLERAITERLGAVAEDWNGGIAGRLRMDDGLPKGMARPMLAAYGDAILPQISEIIGRAILAAAS